MVRSSKLVARISPFMLSLSKHALSLSKGGGVIKLPLSCR